MSELQQSRPAHIVVTSTKSIGIAIILSIFFGPFGLFYASVKGAIFMLLGVPIILAVLAAFAGGHSGAGNSGALFGLGMIPVIIALEYLGSIIWAAIAVNKYNRKLIKNAA